METGTLFTLIMAVPCVGILIYGTWVFASQLWLNVKAQHSLEEWKEIRAEMTAARESADALRMRDAEQWLLTKTRLGLQPRGCYQRVRLR